MNRRKSDIEAMYGISKTLNTNLDRRSIAILLELLELGIHPESLADGKDYLGNL